MESSIITKHVHPDALSQNSYDLFGSCMSVEKPLNFKSVVANDSSTNDESVSGPKYETNSEISNPVVITDINHQSNGQSQISGERNNDILTPMNQIDSNANKNGSPFSDNSEPKDILATACRSVGLHMGDLTIVPIQNSASHASKVTDLSEQTSLTSCSDNSYPNNCNMDISSGQKSLNLNSSDLNYIGKNDIRDTYNGLAKNTNQGIVPPNVTINKRCSINTLPPPHSNSLPTNNFYNNQFIPTNLPYQNLHPYNYQIDKSINPSLGYVNSQTQYYGNHISNLPNNCYLVNPNESYVCSPNILPCNQDFIRERPLAYNDPYLYNLPYTTSKLCVPPWRPILPNINPAPANNMIGIKESPPNISLMKCHRYCERSANVLPNTGFNFNCPQDHISNQIKNQVCPPMPYNESLKNGPNYVILPPPGFHQPFNGKQNANYMENVISPYRSCSDNFPFMGMTADKLINNRIPINKRVNDILYSTSPSFVSGPIAPNIARSNYHSKKLPKLAKPQNKVPKVKNKKEPKKTEKKLTKETKDVNGNTIVNNTSMTKVNEKLSKPNESIVTTVITKANQTISLNPQVHNSVPTANLMINTSTDGNHDKYHDDNCESNVNGNSTTTKDEYPNKVPVVQEKEEPSNLFYQNKSTLEKEKLENSREFEFYAPKVDSNKNSHKSVIFNNETHFSKDETKNCSYNSRPIDIIKPPHLKINELESSSKSDNFIHVVNENVKQDPKSNATVQKCNPPAHEKSFTDNISNTGQAIQKQYISYSTDINQESDIGRSYNTEALLPNTKNKEYVQEHRERFSPVSGIPNSKNKKYDQRYQENISPIRVIEVLPHTKNKKYVEKYQENISPKSAETLSNTKNKNYVQNYQQKFSPIIEKEGILISKNTQYVQEYKQQRLSPINKTGECLPNSKNQHIQNYRGRLSPISVATLPNTENKKYDQEHKETVSLNETAVDLPNTKNKTYHDEHPENVSQISEREEGPPNSKNTQSVKEYQQSFSPISETGSLSNSENQQYVQNYYEKFSPATAGLPNPKDNKHQELQENLSLINEIGGAPNSKEIQEYQQRFLPMSETGEGLPITKNKRYIQEYQQKFSPIIEHLLTIPEAKYLAQFQDDPDKFLSKIVLLWADSEKQSTKLDICERMNENFLTLIKILFDSSTLSSFGWQTAGPEEILEDLLKSLKQKSSCEELDTKYEAMDASNNEEDMSRETSVTNSFAKTPSCSGSRDINRETVGVLDKSRAPRSNTELKVKSRSTSNSMAPRNGKDICYSQGYYKESRSFKRGLDDVSKNGTNNYMPKYSQAKFHRSDVQCGVPSSSSTYNVSANTSHLFST